MLRNYIEAGHLRYVVNKRVIANSLDDINIRLSPNTVNIIFFIFKAYLY